MAGMPLVKGKLYYFGNTAQEVATAIVAIRDKLEDLSSNEHGTASKDLASTLLKDFEERWGKSGEPMFNQQVQRASLKRQKGIHPSFLIATFLDPRTKTLVSIPDEQSRNQIKARVLGLMKQLESESGQGEDDTIPEESKQEDVEEMDRPLGQVAYIDVEGNEREYWLGKFILVGSLLFSHHIIILFGSTNLLLLF